MWKMIKFFTREKSALQTIDTPTDETIQYDDIKTKIA